MATGPGTSLVEVEFVPGTWTDVTADVVGEAAGSIRWRGGRATRYDEVSPSTLTVPLRNADGRFTPGKTTSVHYPNVLRGKRIRWSYTPPGGSLRPQFAGYITRWAVVIPDGNPDDAQCIVEAVDLLAVMDRRTMLNAMIEESRRIAVATAGGCDAFDLSATAINCDPASAAPVTTFSNRGILKAGNTALGSLTVSRSTVAGSPESTGLITASSAPSPPSADEQRDRTSDGPPDDLWLERLRFTPAPAATGGWTGPVLVYTPQGAMRQLDLFFRVDDSFFAPAGSAYERVLVDLWAGSLGVLRVGVGQRAGKICLRVTIAGVVSWQSTTVDVADGVWRKLSVYRGNAGQAVVAVNDAPGVVHSIAADLDSVDVVVIGGARNGTVAGKQNRVWEGDIAGICAQTAVAGVHHSQCLGAPPPLPDASRIAELRAYLTSGLGGTVFYAGSAAQDVARTPMAGRTMLDCMREVARTIGGIVHVAHDGELVVGRSDAWWRVGSPHVTLVLGEDDDLAVGDIVWDDGVDQAPTQVVASWPGGQATAVAAAYEDGAERDLQISTAAVSQAQAYAAAAALIPDAVALCPRQISLDLTVTTANRWSLVEWLIPDTLIEITGAPSAVLGASAWQVRIQGWDAQVTPTSYRLTLDLDSPRPVPVAASGGYTTAAPPDEVVIGATTTAVAGLDRARAENELIIYSHGPTVTTPTNEWGTEWLVTGGVLVGPPRALGSTTPLVIPEGSYVLSGHGTASTWLASLSAGQTVALRAGGYPTTWQPDPPSSGGGGGGTPTYAAPTYVGRQSTAVDFGNISATQPVETAVGDLLVAITHADPDGQTMSAPSGWTSVGAQSNAAGFLAIYTRVATVQMAAHQFTGSNSSANTLSMLAFRGTAVSVSLAPTWGGTAVASTTHAAPSVTPPHDGNLLICAFAGITGAATTWTPPSGMTERADIQHGAQWTTLTVDTEVIAGTTVTGTRTATASAATLAAYGAVTVSLLLTDQTGVSGGGGGGGGGGGSSANRSTLPWANGVFDNVGHTAKVDAFQAMSGRLLDMADQHPAWVDIATSSWWWSPHVGRGYDLMVSVPMYSGSISTNSSAMWSSIAGQLVAAGWSRTWWRLGVEFNLNNSWQANDSNYTTWITRFNEAAAAIRAQQPGARICLCPNEGGGAGLLSQANTLAVVNGTSWDVLTPDYYDQWEPIYNSAQAAARFGTTATFGTMNYWMGVTRSKGRTFGLGEWGVAQGTQWAGHQGGDNAFYIQYLMDWLYANRDVVEVISYFEEPAAYLVSDITTNANNPQARAMYQSKIAQFAGT